VFQHTHQCDYLYKRFSAPLLYPSPVIRGAHLVVDLGMAERELQNAGIRIVGWMPFYMCWSICRRGHLSIIFSALTCVLHNSENHPVYKTRFPPQTMSLHLPQYTLCSHCTNLELGQEVLNLNIDIIHKSLVGNSNDGIGDWKGFLHNAVILSLEDRIGFEGIGLSSAPCNFSVWL
jgi:hypothetical protein